jgi:hypothetical protein
VRVLHYDAFKGALERRTDYETFAKYVGGSYQQRSTNIRHQPEVLRRQSQVCRSTAPQGSRLSEAEPWGLPAASGWSPARDERGFRRFAGRGPSSLVSQAYKSS